MVRTIKISVFLAAVLLLSPTLAAGSEDVDECTMDNPCQNGATCTNIVDSAADTYSCACTAGWEGKDCDTGIDECSPNPCQNNGTCTDAHFDYSCACTAGWEGKDCDTSIDDCASSPCQNGAQCSDAHLDYLCACTAGWEGKDCDTSILSLKDITKSVFHPISDTFAQRAPSSNSKRIYYWAQEFFTDLHCTVSKCATSNCAVS
jgi:hypothetical protein